jgi:hypothetical protein
MSLKQQTEQLQKILNEVENNHLGVMAFICEEFFQSKDINLVLVPPVKETSKPAAQKPKPVKKKKQERTLF